MQFRKICQHPFLFEQVEDEINPGGYINDKIVRASGKFELLSRILPKLFRTGHRVNNLAFFSSRLLLTMGFKVLIFFQMTKVMDIMEDFMKWMNWEYLRLDGGTKTDERAEYVKLWNTPNSTLKVFILSTRAGGLGLNLQTADTVIM
jgi:ATP-dependent helicase STH1/SNF2